MELAGNLRDNSFPGILISLNRQKATGTLTVTTPEFTKKIFFSNGNAIFAASTLEDDRLGEMLLKAGKIKLEQYEKSVAMLKTTGDRQGAILVELGYITPKDLFWGVKYQVKEIIYSLFGLDEGSYEFSDNVLSDNEVITLQMSIENLVYEGIKRINRIARIRKEMPDTNAVFRMDKDRTIALRGIDLSPDDRMILSLIDGRKTAKQIIEESSLNSFDVMKTLYVLLITDFIIEEKHPAHEEESVSLDDILDSMSEEEKAFAAKVDDLYNRIGDMGPEEILEANEDTDSATIKKNYYRLAKEFHPDRFFNAGNKLIQKKLVTIFDAVTKAYNLLKDETKKREYFESLAVPVRKEDDTKAALIEEQFGRGIEEFKKGNYWGAADLFQWLTREDPKNPKAWSYLALSLTRIPQKLKNAEEALMEAIKLDHFNSDHFANLGLIYLKADMKKRAHAQFEKALKLNPENTKAMKGIEETKE